MILSFANTLCTKKKNKLNLLQRKKLTLGFVAIFCIQFNLFSEPSNNICPSFSDRNSENDQRFVEFLYPGAQIWFNAMAQKYPQAHLNKIKFCVSDAYEAGLGIIYFPESRLITMNDVFNNSNALDINDDRFAQFAEDEYLLLHEAMHVLSDDAQSRHLATLFAIGSVMALNSWLCYKVVNNDMRILTQIAGSALSASFGYVVLSAYARFQESRADNFANQNADVKALRAVACWFERLSMLTQCEHTLMPEIFHSLLIIIQDPEHPSLQSRAKKALQALQIRFAQTV